MTSLVQLQAVGHASHRPVVDLIEESGLEIRADAASAESRRGVDILLIASDVEAPLQVARTFRERCPEAHLVFLTRDESEPLRRALRVARLGSDWSIAPETDPPLALQTIRRAIEVIRRRRKQQATLGRINQQLARPRSPASRPVRISDHFLASVLDQLPDAVAILDEWGLLLAYNGTAARAFGTLPRGASLLEGLPETVRLTVRSASSSEHGFAETLLVAANGAEYSLRVTTLRDDRGLPAGTALVARDVTEVRRNDRRREQVAEAVRLLASTLDARVALQRLATFVASDLGDMSLVDVAEGDMMHRYAVAGRSERQHELMERTRAINAATNRNHPTFAAAERGETIVRNRITAETLHAVATSEEHYRILKELAPHCFVVAPLRASETTVGALLVARNSGPEFSRADIEVIDEIARQAATALRNIWSYHAIDEASRLKDEFLTTLSHELRTPMTSILGWAQMLQRDTPPSGELLVDGLASIERSARAQAQLIDDLLDLSRLQIGKVQFQSRAFRLGEIVRGAVETIRPSAQSRGVAVSVEIHQDATIDGDPDRIQQVIWNLLSNSVKFSDAGGSVRVRLEIGAGLARLTVADQGRGIDRRFLPHVFERFRQADSSHTHGSGGLGLGLAIVKQLVEMHGGQVHASSEGLGKGAAFTVLLPARTHSADAPP